METVKEFYLSSRLADLKDGLVLVNKVREVVYSNLDLKEEAVKVIVRKIGELFYIGPLQDKLQEIFMKLLDRFPEVTSQTMFEVLRNYSTIFSSISGSLSQAKLVLPPLRWTLLLLSKVEVTLNYLDLLSVLLSAVPATPSTQRLFIISCKELQRKLLNREVAIHWLKLILPAPFKLPYLVLIAVLLKYLMGTGSIEDFPSSIYTDILKLFAAEVLGSRKLVNSLIIQSCGDLFIKVSHALFKDILLPAVRKALLRNPDELVSTVSFLLSSVPIDLSVYCADLSKLIIPLLDSSDAATSASALDCMCALCCQCSDKMVAQELCQQLDGALKSKDPKPKSKL